MLGLGLSTISGRSFTPTAHSPASHRLRSHCRVSFQTFGPQMRPYLLWIWRRRCSPYPSPIRQDARSGFLHLQRLVRTFPPTPQLRETTFPELTSPLAPKANLMLLMSRGHLKVLSSLDARVWKSWSEVPSQAFAVADSLQGVHLLQVFLGSPLCSKQVSAPCPPSYKDPPLPHSLCHSSLFL